MREGQAKKKQTHPERASRPPSSEADFWSSHSLEELAKQQQVKPVDRLSDLFGTWPGEMDDGFEEAIMALRRQSPAVRGRG